MWIVQQAGSPHDAILGVFDASAEAGTFAEEVKGQFENGVISSAFAILQRASAASIARTIRISRTSSSILTAPSVTKPCFR